MALGLQGVTCLTLSPLRPTCLLVSQVTDGLAHLSNQWVPGPLLKFKSTQPLPTSPQSGPLLSLTVPLTPTVRTWTSLSFTFCILKLEG